MPNPPANRYALERAREEGRQEERRRQQDLAVATAFAERVGASLMVLLANTPYSQWPELAKTAYRHEASKTPTAEWLYSETLPKE